MFTQLPMSQIIETVCKAKPLVGRTMTCSYGLLLSYSRPYVSASLLALDLDAPLFQNMQDSLYFSPPPGSTVPVGPDPFILQMLAEALHFNVNYSYMNWGWFDENGTWSGQISKASF